MTSACLRAVIAPLVLVSALLAGTAAGAAVDLSRPTAAAGQWDMSLADTNRKCRFVLRAESDANAAALPVAMPAGCRRALPILAEIGKWSLGVDRTLRLDDADGTPVLEFKPAPNSVELTAKGPEGEIYQLVAEKDADLYQQQQRQMAQAPVQSRGFVEQAPLGTGFQPTKPTPAPAQATSAPRTVANREAPAPVRGPVAGRYAPLRDAGRDTGCMITLDDKTRGPHGTNKAQLAPACRDQGLVIFDPVGWQVEHGRLVLTARKGHKAHFERQENGTWARDSKEGKALALRPM